MRGALLALVVALSCSAPSSESATPSAESGDSTEAVLGASQAPTPVVADVEEAAPAPTSVGGTTGDGSSVPDHGVASALTLTQRYDFAQPAWSEQLPGRLDEVSGLAFSPEGRLFAHDDERGRIHEIDPRTGEVGKRFDLGEDMARDDFEGVAVAGDRFFLISSTGLLYELREAEDREASAFRVTDTGVGAWCEVEGLDYDPVEDALWIACKVATPNRGTIVVHRLPLDPDRPRMLPLEISRAELRAHGLDADFEASAIALDPRTGTLVLASGSHESLLEVDREGSVLDGVRLQRSRHRQTEGLGFGPDGTLYLADERNDGGPRLTAYALRSTAPGGTP